MALIPKNAYPAQTLAADANYPQGKARNQVVPGDGIGTPLEEQWVNDLWGFLQAILDYGAVTPSGTPDNISASDYLDALRTKFLDRTAVQTISGVMTFTGVCSFTNDVAFDSDALFNDPVLVDDTFTCTGVATFTGGIIATGSCTFQELTVTNPASFPSGLSCGDVITGSPRLRRAVVTGADSNQTYNVTQATTIYVPALTGIRDYTLGDTGAADGDEIEIVIAWNAGITDYIVPKRSDTSTISTVLVGGDSSTGATHRYAKFKRISGQWEFVYGEPAPDI